MSNIKYELKRNEGFYWVISKGIYFKGYFFLDDIFYNSKNILNLFNNNSKANTFFELIENANGVFAIIVEDENKVYFATDRLRAIPLFYTFNENKLKISDHIVEDISKVNHSSSEYIEFLMTGFTLNDSTLLPDYKQLQASEYAIFDMKTNLLEKKAYYNHLHRNFFKLNESEHFSNLTKITVNFINRLIQSANGRKIVVPLSGGYDSRYIVSALRYVNHENVICYSYGNKDSFEINTARNVAKQLGYKIIIIEYTEEKWKNLLSQEQFREYVEYSFNFTSVPHTQDFIALTEMKSKKLIPDDSIIVPGYCGDLIAGSIIPNEYFENKQKKLLKEGITKYILRRHFGNSDEKIEKNIEQQILKKNQDFIKDIYAENSLDEFVSVNEAWFTNNRVAKFILNSLRAYEFFGYEWRIPLYDKELVEYWYRIPTDSRIETKLYTDFLFKQLFEKQNIDFYKKKPVSHNALFSFIRHILPSTINTKLKKIYHKIIYRNNRYDVNSYNYFTNELIKEANINPEIYKHYKNINIFIAYWLLHK